VLLALMRLAAEYRDGGGPAARVAAAQLPAADARRVLVLACGLLAAVLDDKTAEGLWSFAEVSAQPPLAGLCAPVSAAGPAPACVRASAFCAWPLAAGPPPVT
jgi:hypothetical protein